MTPPGRLPSRPGKSICTARAVGPVQPGAGGLPLASAAAGVVAAIPACRRTKVGSAIRGWRVIAGLTAPAPRLADRQWRRVLLASTPSASVTQGTSPYETPIRRNAIDFFARDGYRHRQPEVVAGQFSSTGASRGDRAPPATTSCTQHHGIAAALLRPRSSSARCLHTHCWRCRLSLLEGLFNTRVATRRAHTGPFGTSDWQADPRDAGDVWHKLTRCRCG